MHAANTVVYVEVIPDCDLCQHKTPAYADARIPNASRAWGFLCFVHFMMYGCKLGLGQGQILIVGESPTTERTDEDVHV